jgi:hypothetical protein
VSMGVSLRKEFEFHDLVQIGKEKSSCRRVEGGLPKRRLGSGKGEGSEQ